MPKITVPPKNNIYTLMMVVTTIVFVIGLIINGVKLSDYKSVQDVDKAPRMTVPEIEAPQNAAPADNELGAPLDEAPVDFE